MTRHATISSPKRPNGTTNVPTQSTPRERARASPSDPGPIRRTQLGIKTRLSADPLTCQANLPAALMWIPTTRGENDFRAQYRNRTLNNDLKSKVLSRSARPQCLGPLAPRKLRWPLAPPRTKRANLAGTHLLRSVHVSKLTSRIIARGNPLSPPTSRRLDRKPQLDAPRPRLVLCPSKPATKDAKWLQYYYHY